MMRAIPVAALLAGLLLAAPGSAASAVPVQQHAAAPLTAAPGCPIFPPSNVWNEDISGLPVAGNSGTLLTEIGNGIGLHPDFGTNPAYGIPYNVVGGTQAKVSVPFNYASESDPGPYPIPANPLIEGNGDPHQLNGDQHMLIVDRDNCILYELYNAQQNANGSWMAGSGAIWNLNSNALRPAGWTSADAAGLPILPGLARYDELARGIDHALRFTASCTTSAYIYPARHFAVPGYCKSPPYPPMGLRVRLKASVDISHFLPQPRAILAALKKYGMILADNGTSWFIGGTSDPRWNDSDLHTLNRITSSNLEVVDTSRLIGGPNPCTAVPIVPATPGPGLVNAAPPTPNCSLSARMLGPDPAVVLRANLVLNGNLVSSGAISFEYHGSGFSLPSPSLVTAAPQQAKVWLTGAVGSVHGSLFQLGDMVTITLDWANRSLQAEVRVDRGAATVLDSMQGSYPRPLTGSYIWLHAP